MRRKTKHDTKIPLFPKTQDISILSIDPGNFSAWAFYCGGKIYWGHFGEIKDWRFLWSEGAELFKELISAFGPINILLVENQYVGFNPASALSIAEKAQTWACLGQYFGAEFIFKIRPSSWQSILKSKVRNRKALAAVAMPLAKDFTQKPKIVLTEDEVSALCILKYFLTKYIQCN